MSSNTAGSSFLFRETEPLNVVIPDDMGDDERLLMQSIQEFATQEVVPKFDQIDRRDKDVILSLFRKAASLGLFMAEVPEAHGGLGMNLLAIAGMSETRSSLGGLASTVFAHQGIGTLPLVNFGTKGQRDKYLESCMNGTVLAAFALTEPSSGSDAMNIRTTAVLNETSTHYVVNGNKQWITNAGWADLFILFAKVDGTDFTAFLLDRAISGLTVGQHEKLLGLDGSSVCSLTLEDVLIPVENVLGEIGKGHRVAMCTLNLGRMKMAANCAGTSKKALSTATEYACERRQFGTALVNFGLIQAKLSEMAAKAYSCESMAYRTAGLVYQALQDIDTSDHSSLDSKFSTLSEYSVECAISKVFGSETYNGLADETLQIFGGNGYSEHYPAARMYRDSRITRIYEGTSEICRLSISKSILKRLRNKTIELPTWVPPHDLPACSPELSRADSLYPVIARTRAVYQKCLMQLTSTYDTTRLLENDLQFHLSNLATIAIEIFAVESTVLRAIKLELTRKQSVTGFATLLAHLACEQGISRIRSSATDILSSLESENSLEDSLTVLNKLLPIPVNKIHLHKEISAALISSGGLLPNFARSSKHHSH